MHAIYVHIKSTTQTRNLSLKTFSTSNVKFYGTKSLECAVKHSI